MKKYIYLLSLKDSDILFNGGDRLSLGVGYLASYLQGYGCDTKIIDLNHQNLEDYDTPELVGISFTTPLFNRALETAKEVKKLFPNALLVGGGSHVSALPDDERLNIFDHLVAGEGEDALANIVLGLEDDKVIRGKIFNNLDDINPPNRHDYPMESYSLKLLGEKATPIITSRGCPYSCCFCGKQVSGKKYRKHGVEYVADEVEEIINNFGIDHFIFYDDVFTLLPDRVKSLGDEFKKRGLNIKYRATTRTNLVNDKILDDLVGSGCVEVCYGLESGDNNILCNINKGVSVEFNRKIVEDSVNKGLLVKGYFIIGLPGENVKSAFKTVAFAKSLPLVSADFYALNPMPGSPLWDNPESFGMVIDKENFGSLQTGDSYISTKSLSNYDIDELLKSAREDFKKWKSY